MPKVTLTLIACDVLLGHLQGGDCLYEVEKRTQDIVHEYLVLL